MQCGGFFVFFENCMPPVNCFVHGETLFYKTRNYPYKTSKKRRADGTTGTATTDESGKTEAAVTISEAAAASDELVALPIPAVTAATDSEAASTITVTLDPQGNAIRSHVAQMFMNFMTKVGI